MADTLDSHTQDTRQGQSSPYKSILYFILALAFVRGMIYAAVVPPWQAPDEPAQFERVRAALTAAEWVSTSKNPPDWYGELSRSLFTFNFWDFLDDSRPKYSPDTSLSSYIVLYQEAYNGLYGNRLAYAIIGWPLFLVRHQDIALQLYLVRINTVLMNIGIILLAYLITQTIFPHDTFLILGVPILILFNPQHSHLLSTVNNGNLAELLATAALYFIVVGIIKGFSWLNILAILGFTLAAMWTKATAYFLPFAISSIGLFYLWRHRGKWRWLLPASLILIGLVYFFIPTRLVQLIYSGWIVLNTGDFYLDPIVPIDLFRSYWAMPGWMILRIDSFWYWILLICCTLAVIGLIILLVGKWRLLTSKRLQPQIQALAVLAVAAVVAIGVLLAWNAITNSIVYRQGRSIYPVVVPLSIFLMLGWRQFIPHRWRGVGLLGITLTLFLFDTMVLFNYIIPLFYSRY